MTKVINCDDGTVIRGENDAELLTGAHRHMDDAHPELELSDEELLGMAVDETARA